MTPEEFETTKEKDVEIERLSTVVEFLSFQNGLYHKPLLARAANALESYHRFRKEHLVDCNTCELIAELRKAAQC